MTPENLRSVWEVDDPAAKRNVDLARFDWEWRNGDRKRAIGLAREYIAAHYAEVAPHLQGKTRDELVGMVSAYRVAGGHEEDIVVVDMWMHAGCVESTSVVGRVPIPVTSPTGHGVREFDVERIWYEWRTGRKDVARELAAELAGRFRTALGPVFQSYTLDELVSLASYYREAGSVADALAVSAWILAEYDPQRIVGFGHIGGVMGR